MTSQEETFPDDTTPAALRSEQVTARILELLEKLAAAEGLSSAASATGIPEGELRSSLREAAEIIRKKQDPMKKRWPILGSLLDWREMTIAEALEILADHTAQHDGVTEPVPQKEEGD